MKKKLVAPQHIALIPDGNRRWAMLHKLRVFTAYRRGITQFIEFAKWSKEFGVKTISVWALSSENLKGRTGAELRILFALYTRAARSKKVLDDLKNNGARLRVVGNIGVLPKMLRDALRDAERQTEMYKDLTINLLINYGGREDIIYSVQKIAKELKSSKGSRIDEDTIQEHLRSSTLPDVDLIVRTSGEMRLSGLLPWQGGYSELYFAKKCWPDFNKSDFRRIIETFSRRQRRFGK